MSALGLDFSHESDKISSKPTVLSDLAPSKSVEIGKPPDSLEAARPSPTSGYSFPGWGPLRRILPTAPSKPPLTEDAVLSKIETGETKQPKSEIGLLSKLPSMGDFGIGTGLSKISAKMADGSRALASTANFILQPDSRAQSVLA